MKCLTVYYSLLQDSWKKYIGLLSTTQHYTALCNTKIYGLTQSMNSAESTLTVQNETVVQLETAVCKIKLDFEETVQH